MVTAIEGTGTDEARWSGWDATERWPEVPPSDFGRPLVVAPHPDDEVLGVGGLLGRLGHADIVAVTDGEASHPTLDPAARRELAATRCAETQAALAELGGDLTVLRVRQPDGGVDEAALAEVLVPRLWPGRSCLATWRADGHPDHEAVGRAAATACAATGARLWEYPIWMWHWAGPGDPRVPWERAARIALPPAAGAAKARAIAAFTSQITPIDGCTILPDHVLRRFRRRYEVVFR